MTDSMAAQAAQFLDRAWYQAEHSLTQAKTRRGVTPEEILNLERKRDVIKWLIGLVIRERKAELTEAYAADAAKLDALYQAALDEAESRIYSQLKPHDILKG